MRTAAPNLICILKNCILILGHVSPRDAYRLVWEIQVSITSLICSDSVTIFLFLVGRKKWKQQKKGSLKKQWPAPCFQINHSRTKLEWKIQNSDQYLEKRNQKAMFYCMIHALRARKQPTVNTGFQGWEACRDKSFFNERSQGEPAGRNSASLEMPQSCFTKLMPACLGFVFTAGVTRQRIIYCFHPTLELAVGDMSKTPLTTTFRGQAGQN